MYAFKEKKIDFREKEKDLLTSHFLFLLDSDEEYYDEYDNTGKIFLINCHTPKVDFLK